MQQSSKKAKSSACLTVLSLHHLSCFPAFSLLHPPKIASIPAYQLSDSPLPAAFFFLFRLQRCHINHVSPFCCYPSPVYLRFLLCHLSWVLFYKILKVIDRRGCWGPSGPAVCFCVGVSQCSRPPICAYEASVQLAPLSNQDCSTKAGAKRWPAQWTIFCSVLSNDYIFVFSSWEINVLGDFLILPFVPFSHLCQLGGHISIFKKNLHRVL